MSGGLILQGVHTHIGRYHILQGVDFAAPEGETTMLLGRNGAGKTTALRTIMGLWRASQGNDRARRRADRRLGDPRHRAQLASPMCRRRWRFFPTSA